MIEVVHNIDKLPCRVTLRVTNPRLAYEYLYKVTDAKRSRGMRLRHSVDLPTSSILLEARNTLPIDVAVCNLRAAGFVRKVICQ